MKQLYHSTVFMNSPICGFFHRTYLGKLKYSTVLFDVLLAAIYNAAMQESYLLRGITSDWNKEECKVIIWWDLIQNTKWAEKWFSGPKVNLLSFVSSLKSWRLRKPLDSVEEKKTLIWGICDGKKVKGQRSLPLYDPALWNILGEG